MQLRFVTLRHVTFTLCCFTLCSNILIYVERTRFFTSDVSNQYSLRSKLTLCRHCTFFRQFGSLTSVAGVNNKYLVAYATLFFFTVNTVTPPYQWRQCYQYRLRIGDKFALVLYDFALFSPVSLKPATNRPSVTTILTERKNSKPVFST